MSTNREYPTEQEIQHKAMQALHNSLGVSGLIRFIQQYDNGTGDYTKDRHQWQKDYTVDSLFKAIKEGR